MCTIRNKKSNDFSQTSIISSVYLQNQDINWKYSYITSLKFYKIWELSDPDTECKFVRMWIAFIIGVVCFLPHEAGTCSNLSAVSADICHPK